MSSPPPGGEIKKKGRAISANVSLYTNNLAKKKRASGTASQRACSKPLIPAYPRISAAFEVHIRHGMGGSFSISSRHDTWTRLAPHTTFIAHVAPKPAAA